MPIPLRYYRPQNGPMYQPAINGQLPPSVVPMGGGFQGPPVSWSSGASAQMGTQDQASAMSRQFDQNAAMRWAPSPAMLGWGGSLNTGWPAMDALNRAWLANNGKMGANMGGGTFPLQPDRDAQLAAIQQQLMAQQQAVMPMQMGQQLGGTMGIPGGR